jgi:hypothetical protein
MPKKKIISEKVKSSESLRGSKGITIIEYQPLDMPLAYGYVADCLSIIAENCKSLSSGRQRYSSRYINIPSIEECILAIQNCINEGRLDLIEKAARLLQGDKKLLTLIMLRDTVDMCTDVPDDEGCGSDVILPSKAAVLEVFKLRFPNHKEHIPTSKRQLAEWWKEAECGDLPQDRGAQDTQSVEFWLKDLKGN